LPKRIPHHIAMEMILTAEPRTATDMYQFGFVNRLVEPGTALDEAMKLAELLVRNGPLAVRASKEIAWRSVTERWTEEECWANQQ